MIASLNSDTFVAVATWSLQGWCLCFGDLVGKSWTAAHVAGRDLVGIIFSCA